jgi:hypothetical protein
MTLLPLDTGNNEHWATAHRGIAGANGHVITTMGDGNSNSNNGDNNNDNNHSSPPNYDDNNSRNGDDNNCPLPHSKHKMEGALIFHLFNTNEPSQRLMMGMTTCVLRSGPVRFFDFQMGQPQPQPV